MIFLHQQLDFIYLLQELRGPHVDNLFRLLNLLDTSYFVCALIAFVWIGCSGRWGARLAYLLTFNELINATAKQIFKCPRPFTFDPDLAIVQLSSYAFPSGGAQTAMVLGALLICFWKNRWAKPIALSYILIVSFSRIFLGVHFPIDILGGWILGLLIFFAFIKLFPLLEKSAIKWPHHAFIITLALSLLLLPTKRFHTVLSLIGFTTGLYLSNRYSLYFQAPQEIHQKIILGSFAIVTTAAIAFPVVYFLPLYDDWVYLIASLWISLALSPICKKFFSLS